MPVIKDVITSKGGLGREESLHFDYLAALKTTY